MKEMLKEKYFFILSLYYIKNATKIKNEFI